MYLRNTNFRLIGLSRPARAHVSIFGHWGVVVVMVGGFSRLHKAFMLVQEFSAQHCLVTVLNQSMTRFVELECLISYICQATGLNTLA